MTTTIEELDTQIARADEAVFNAHLQLADLILRRLAATSRRVHPKAVAVTYLAETDEGGMRVVQPHIHTVVGTRHRHIAPHDTEAQAIVCDLQRLAAIEPEILCREELLLPSPDTPAGCAVLAAKLALRPTGAGRPTARR